MNEHLLRHTLPVIINAFEQPTYLLRMVGLLVAQDVRNVWILDQASTSPEARDALALLEHTARCRVFRVQANTGPHAFFTSELFALAGRYFVYTDADLDLPRPLPENFLSRFLALTETYRVGKAGCALDLADAESFADETVERPDGRRHTIVEWERQFWQEQLEPDVYRAEIDTTFALYNRAHFQFERFFDGVRVAGAACAKHRPWYRDKRIPEDEWQRYRAAARHSFWFRPDTPATPA